MTSYFLLNSLCRKASTCTAAAVRARQLRMAQQHKVGRVRRMGGAQPESQSMKGELFGGGKRDEGYETITDVTYIFAGILCVVAVVGGPDTSIKTWANNEALARMKLKEAGKVDKFEFGVHYNTDETKFEFEQKSPQSLFDPFDEEGAEDDDDDDDEEDEDEDDEDDE